MFCQNDRNEKLLFYRYTYQYFAALSVTGVNTYTTAEPLDNDTANVKSKPCTGFEIIYFGKPFEYPLLFVGRYAYSRVGYGNNHYFLIFVNLTG